MTLDRCLLSTEPVSRDSQPEQCKCILAYCQDNKFPGFAEAFLIVVPHKKSVFDRILLEASQCHQNEFFVCRYLYFSKNWCNIFSNFVLTLHVVMPLCFTKITVTFIVQ